MCVSHFSLWVHSQQRLYFTESPNFNYQVGLNKTFIAQSVTRPMTALMSMISSRYTGMVWIRWLNLLINIVFTVWRISLITFKHVNNIVDNGRREVDIILLPININQYISIIASILKPSVPSRLLYDEDIKVTIVTGPNSRR